MKKITRILHHYKSIPASWPPLLLNNKIALTIFIAVILYFVFYHDIFRNYLSSPDADIIYAYEALLLNESWRQDLHTHTGYIYILFLGIWIKIAAVLGLIDASNLSALPGPDAFEPVFANVIYMGRWLSALICMSFAWLFFKTMLVVTQNQKISLIVSVLFTISPALIVHSQLMRPEIWAMFFIWLSFFFLLQAMKLPERRGLGCLVLSAFFSLIGIEAKLQVIPLALALPLIALAFKTTGWGSIAEPPQLKYKVEHIVFMLFTATINLLAAVMIIGRIIFAGQPGYYQITIIIYLLSTIWLYGMLSRHSWRTRLLAVCAVFCGLAAGQLMHLITNDPKNTLAMANFIEHMANLSYPSVQNTAGSLSEILKLVPMLIGYSLIDKVNYFGSPAILGYKIIFWCSLFGVIYCYLQDERRKAHQAGILIVIAFGMEVFCRLRYSIDTYLIFSSPWLYSAVAITATKVGFSKSSRSNYLKTSTVICLATLFFINGLGAHHPSLLFKQEISNACHQANTYLKELPGYFQHYCP